MLKNMFFLNIKNQIFLFFYFMKIKFIKSSKAAYLRLSHNFLDTQELYSIETFEFICDDVINQEIM